MFFGRSSLFSSIENATFGSPVANPLTSPRTKSACPEFNGERSPSASIDHDAEPSVDVETEVSNAYERDRCSVTVSGEHEPNVVLKDNDLKYKFRLPKHVARQVQAQLENDAHFLHSIDVMDYSLLVGVHNTEYEVQSDIGETWTSANSKKHRNSIVPTNRFGSTDKSGKSENDEDSSVANSSVDSPTVTRKKLHSDDTSRIASTESSEKSSLIAIAPARRLEV
jgi:hypothetical protein